MHQTIDVEDIGSQEDDTAYGVGGAPLGTMVGVALAIAQDIIVEYLARVREDDAREDCAA